MTRRPLLFRISVGGSWFLRVAIHDGRKEMLRAVSECHGERAVHEHAATVYAPGCPERGCVADLFFSWRVMRPSIIAHEAAHAADAIALALKKGISPDSDEFRAQWVERITERIWLRSQAAPL